MISMSLISLTIQKEPSHRHIDRLDAGINIRYNHTLIHIVTFGP